MGIEPHSTAAEPDAKTGEIKQGEDRRWLFIGFAAVGVLMLVVGLVIAFAAG